MNFQIKVCFKIKPLKTRFERFLTPSVRSLQGGSPPFNPFGAYKVAAKLSSDSIAMYFYIFHVMIAF